LPEAYNYKRNKEKELYFSVVMSFTVNGGLIGNISVFLKERLDLEEEGEKGDSLDLEFIARFVLTAAVGTLVTHGI